MRRGPTCGVWTAAAALAAALLAVVPDATWAQGCAMCSTYMSAVDQQRAEGFRISVMFLGAMPFVVVACAGGWITWMFWRHRPPRASLHRLHPEKEGSS
jgi:hypothetical protein